jgi:outer membrane protein TolC
VPDAQAALLNVRTEELTARVNLHLALGGSFDPEHFAGPTP